MLALHIELDEHSVDPTRLNVFDDLALGLPLISDLFDIKGVCFKEVVNSLDQVLDIVFLFATRTNHNIMVLVEVGIHC